MCTEVEVIGDESKFAPSERYKFGFGIYKYIGMKLPIADGELIFLNSSNLTVDWRDPVYLLSQNTSSRVGLITRYLGRFWFGWVNSYLHVHIDYQISRNRLLYLYNWLMFKFIDWIS